MHILIGIISAIGALIFIAYRLTYVAREGQEVISDAKGLIRRHQWSSKHKHNPLDDIQDPREIALLLMTETARYKGALTANQQHKISELAQQKFQIANDELDDMISAVAFATKDLTDIDNVLHKMLRPLYNTLDENEKNELITMMQEIAAVDGNPTPDQLHLIGRTQDKLLS